jgi:dinuclear metal center YbgI/SA1388 family protein
MKPANGQTIIQAFEQLAPKKLAMEGDPIGLQIGRLNKPVKKIMVALDVLESVVDEAIQANVDLIIAHHPILYRPLKRLNTELPQGRIIEKLIKHDITFYAAHTNLDVAKGGVNDLMAEELGLKDISVLIPTTDNKGETLGLGRIGTLPEKLTLEQFAQRVKTVFDVKGARVVGSLTNEVQKVAVLGGDGNDFASHARFQGADVLVTGDIKYHIAHDAEASGLNIVDPGHNVEKVMKQGVMNYLQQFLTKENYDTTVIVSKMHTDPFSFV